MAEDKLTESSATQIDQEVKTEPRETDASSADSKPLHKTPELKNNDNISVPNEKIGNGPEKNGQKRIQTTPLDGTSKKPRINTPPVTSFNAKKACGDEMDLTKKAGGDEIDLIKKEGEDEMDLSSDTEEHYLTVHNLPTDWTYMQIKNYLDEVCGHVDEMEMLKHKKSKNCAIRLTFQSLEKCHDVFKKLENKFVQDKKLKVKISDTYTTFPTDVSAQSTIQDSVAKETTEVKAVTRWRPDLDSLDTDPEGLYGLRPEFLKALNITPPLKKMVHVSNFRCDKNELKEVMEMAGNVLMCCVVKTVQRYAKVMYSHPLEAVQAISMLNGQLFYGNPLKISMDKNPADIVFLPKGLANIGQGLGTKARPIRNIVQQYHRYANKQIPSINPVVFSEIDFRDNNNVKTEENSEKIQEKIDEFMTLRPGCNILNPTVPLGVKNIDTLECSDNSKEESDKSVPETTITPKSRRVRNRKPAGFINQDAANKESEKQNSTSPQFAAPALGAAPPTNPVARLSPHSGKGFMPPNLLLNPPVPVPVPGLGEPFYRPGNKHEPPRPFRPRAPFMPPPMQRPPFPRPPFGPTGPPMRPPIPPVGPPMRPPIPPVGPPMRPPIPPAFVGPRANQGNRVTVKFANLPPSTTFPLLCEQLAQCGQVMSVQLTTPGCAVATFGHPSHAERCFQSFKGMNVEGFIIDVTFA